MFCLYFTVLLGALEFTEFVSTSTDEQVSVKEKKEHCDANYRVDVMDSKFCCALIKEAPTGRSKSFVLGSRCKTSAAEL